MAEVDPYLWGIEQGTAGLRAHRETEGRQLEKYYGRTGASVGEYMPGALRAQQEAEDEARSRMKAKLGEAQLRQKLWQRRLEIMEKMYKQQKKDAQRERKQAMYTAALGSAAQIGGGVLASGMLGGGGGGGGGAPFSGGEGNLPLDLG